MFLVELFEDQQKSAVFSFGRMNPPTVGHQKLMQRVMDLASEKNADVFIVPSKTQDKKKNPLSFEQKKYFIEKIYGFPVYDNPTMKSPFQMAGWLGEQGYKDVTFVVGSDRVEAFKGIEEHYAKDFGGIFKVVSAGERDPDADGVEGMSASVMREFAKEGNMASFMKGLPPETKIGIAKELMIAVRDGLK